MDWSVFEPFKLELDVALALLIAIALGGFRVGPGETLPYRRAARRRFDEHEPPGLARPDRRGMAGKFDERINKAGIDGLAAKSADVAAPKHEVAERLPECRGKAAGRFVEHLGHIATPSIMRTKVLAVENRRRSGRRVSRALVGSARHRGFREC